MLEKLKHLLKHSAVYGLSNAAIKASGIILLPIYTFYFSPDEYGRLGLFLITTVILIQVLAFGQGISIIRFNNSKDFKDNSSSIFFSIIIIIVLIVGSFVIISEVTLPLISNTFDRPDLYYENLKICIYIVAFGVFNNIFMNKLRADDRSMLYLIAGLIKLTILLLVTIYLIVVVNLNIEGVLLGQLAGEISFCLIVLPEMIKKIKPKLISGIIPQSLRFGGPLIFSALAMNLLNGSDRFLIKIFSGEFGLGIYELAYRFSSVLYMFIIMPFNLTLLPIAYKIFGQEDDARYYSKIKTYITFMLVWSGLAISIFGKEIIMLFAQQESYYPAYNYVGIISLSYVIYGMSTVSTLGMYLTGNNKFIAYSTIIAAIINIILNLIFIPEFGIIAAALSTLISFGVLELLSYFASQHYYRIPYENMKIAWMIVIGIALYLISMVFPGQLNVMIQIGLKVVLVVSYPLLIFIFKLYEKVELQRIQGSLRKWTRVENLGLNLKEELKKFKKGID